MSDDKQVSVTMPESWWRKQIETLREDAEPAPWAGPFAYALEKQIPITEPPVWSVVADVFANRYVRWYFMERPWVTADGVRYSWDELAGGGNITIVATPQENDR